MRLCFIQEGNEGLKLCWDSSLTVLAAVPFFLGPELLSSELNPHKFVCIWVLVVGSGCMSDSFMN